MFKLRHGRTCKLWPSGSIRRRMERLTGLQRGMQIMNPAEGFLSAETPLAPVPGKSIYRYPILAFLGGNTMKKQLCSAIFGLTILLATGASYAQGGFMGMVKEDFSATLSMTTEYVFRGQSFSGEEPAIQGSFDFSRGNFFAGVWGSSLKGERGVRSQSVQTPIDFSIADNRPAMPVDCSAETSVSSCAALINGDATLDDAEKAEAIGQLFTLSTVTANDGFELEVDLYLGYTNSIGGVEWYIQPIYYWFPDADDASGAETDQFEIWLGASYTFPSTASTLSGLYAYSPDFTLEDGNGHYFYGNLSFALPNDFNIDGGIGYQDVEGDKTTPDGYDYLQWDAGVTLSRLGFDFDLRYYDTDEDDSLVAFWGGDENIDARIVFSVSRSF